MRPRVERRGRGRKTQRHRERVLGADLIAVDGGRTKPLGSARERRAVQVSVSCEVGGGLRR